MLTKQIVGMRQCECKLHASGLCAHEICILNREPRSASLQVVSVGGSSILVEYINVLP